MPSIWPFGRLSYLTLKGRGRLAMQAEGKGMAAARITVVWSIPVSP
jgi:hypothetical protein